MESEILCFSPTGGGKKVAEAIRRGLENIDGGNVVPCIFAVPVYGGHMPELAKKRFKDVNSRDKRPAVLVAVYGNRAFENALADLDAFVRGRGFNPVAAGAFVCEHSYSTKETPIASGRPDADDLKAAEEFGRQVGMKLAFGDLSSVDAAGLEDEPSPEDSVRRFSAFVREYREMQASRPQKYVPEYDVELCSGCGACIEACPAGAVRDDFSIDDSLCIDCCACVKICPAEARSFKSPFAVPLAENFSVRKSPRWIL